MLIVGLSSHESGSIFAVNSREFLSPIFWFGKNLFANRDEEVMLPFHKTSPFKDRSVRR